MSDDIEGTTRSGAGWTAWHADTVDVARELPSDSVDFSVFSPPFASLYTYSNSPRDMGNVRDHDEFFKHYSYLIKEQFRVMKPGRNASIHCMLMPTSKERDGYIGLRDFRGDIIRAYEAAGFIFHSEVVIWKDPVTAMQRTKALGLLHKTIRKDSAMSRQGIPDYVVTVRKPGTNPDPIQHRATDRRTGKLVGPDDAEVFEVEKWQRIASPIWNDVPIEDHPVELQGLDAAARFMRAATCWMDIDPSDTLQYRSAREHDDERHICPLQLGVIRRCIELWTRPNDIVWSPFMGIGSEGVVALEMGRRFIGAELKGSYFEQAARNLATAEGVKQGDLFAQPEPVSAADSG